MDISTEIAAIEAASKGEELRQPMIDALNALNGVSLPAVTSSDAGKILKVNSSGEWVAGEKSGYMPVPSAIININENGTIDVTNYSQAIVAVSGSGGIELIPRDEWSTLTTSQKKAKGLIAIQDYSTGFNRGVLVNGADYVPANIMQSGTGVNSATFTAQYSGSYSLAVIALNSEASTYQLNVALTQNGNNVIGTEVAFNSYSNSGTNRRNYRITVFDVHLTAGDTMAITVSNTNSHSALVYAVTDAELNTLLNSLSTADATCSGSYSSNGIVVYGTFNNNIGGTINMAAYNSGATITTDNPGNNYKSAYIFWFDE